MLGDAILIAPKLTEPNDIEKFEQIQSVKFFLPEEELWYNYYNKEIEWSTGQEETVFLEDLE